MITANEVLTKAYKWLPGCWLREPCLQGEGPRCLPRTRACSSTPGGCEVSVSTRAHGCRAPRGSEHWGPDSKVLTGCSAAHWRDQRDTRCSASPHLNSCLHPGMHCTHPRLGADQTACQVPGCTGPPQTGLLVSDGFQHLSAPCTHYGHRAAPVRWLLPLRRVALSGPPRRSFPCDPGPQQRGPLCHLKTERQAVPVVTAWTAGGCGPNRRAPRGTTGHRCPRQVPAPAPPGALAGLQVPPTPRPRRWYSCLGLVT